jgi:hypothetical protein
MNKVFAANKPPLRANILAYGQVYGRMENLRQAFIRMPYTLGLQLTDIRAVISSNLCDAVYEDAVE